VYARRARSVKRGSSGVGSIRRDSYGTVNGFNTKAGWWEIRDKVYRRDGGLCRALKPDGTQCKAPGVDVHHIISLSKGGTTSMMNLITLCKGCHSKRHNHLFRARRK
jgi:5-methylcytosine-specific restriction endonuclease McrA